MNLVPDQYRGGAGAQRHGADPGAGRRGRAGDRGAMNLVPDHYRAVPAANATARTQSPAGGPGVGAP
jgi:hypothetical protein